MWSCRKCNFVNGSGDFYCGGCGEAITFTTDTPYLQRVVTFAIAALYRREWATADTARQCVERCFSRELADADVCDVGTPAREDYTLRARAAYAALRVITFRTQVEKSRAGVLSSC